MQLHRSIARPAVLAAVLAFGLAAAMAGPAQALGADLKKASSPVVCTVATLSVSLGPRSGTGTVHAPLRFTDTGHRPCVIQGFPRVAYAKGGEGDQVGRFAQVVGGSLGPVTLQPGQVASAALTMVQPSSYGKSICRPTAVGGLMVYPPNNNQWVFVPLPRGATGCAGHPSDPQLKIASVKAGV